MQSSSEVNQYGGVGTANNYVNMYVTKDTSASYYQTAYNQNGYGGMAFYSSETCGYEIGGTLWPNNSECTSNYKDSNVKNVVDAWALDKIPSGLQEARLITKDEYISYCLEEEYQSTPSDISTRFVPQYDWIYNNNYTYWTMTSYEDSDSDVWIVVDDGGISSLNIFEDGGYRRTVRPVIVLDKSVLN